MVIKTKSINKNRTLLQKPVFNLIFPSILIFWKKSNNTTYLH